MNGGPRDRKGFTIRERLLIADYLRTLGANATESAKKAGYSGNRNTLGVIAHETLKRPKIAREIERRMARKLSTEDIESEIAEVALTPVQIDAPAKMKALDLLTKINGMVTQKVETKDVTEQSHIVEQTILKRSERTGEDAETIALSLLESFQDEPEFLQPEHWGKFAYLLSKPQEATGVQ